MEAAMEHWTVNLKNENMQGGGKYVQCDCKIRVRFF